MRAIDILRFYAIGYARIGGRGVNGDIYSKNLNPALAARRANAEDR
jgi:hypothetical protein